MTNNLETPQVQETQAANQSGNSPYLVAKINGAVTVATAALGFVEDATGAHDSARFVYEMAGNSAVSTTVAALGGLAFAVVNNYRNRE